MMAEFEKVTQRLEQWSSGKAVILSGHGGDFCTGVDLDLVRNILHSEGGQKMSSYLHDLLTQFSNLPLISVAVIPGIAVGGGAELTTACDFTQQHAILNIHQYVFHLETSNLFNHLLDIQIHSLKLNNWYKMFSNKRYILIMYLKILHTCISTDLLVKFISWNTFSW